MGLHARGVDPRTGFQTWLSPSVETALLSVETALLSAETALLSPETALLVVRQTRISQLQCSEASLELEIPLGLNKLKGERLSVRYQL